MAALRKIQADEFARRLYTASRTRDEHFAFFLGAGCSVSSGIPAAGSLVKDIWLPQLRDLCAPERHDLETWAHELFAGYDADNPASLYGNVMARLFLTPEHRQHEIERLCDGRFPGFGYAVLATLVAAEGGHFNVVITTNFDDLVADALYLFAPARPLVIAHESLAEFIRPTRTRPLVVKLHGDAHLSPLNTTKETAALQQEVQNQVAGLLHDRGLVFLGYGGNDGGIEAMLNELPDRALPFGIYWMSKSEPQGVLRSWLERRDAVWIEQFDFDEMMLLVREAFELPHPDQKRFESVFQNYTEAYKKLSDRIRSGTGKAEDESLKKALDKADKDITGWVAVAIEANKVEKTDPSAADKIYQEGIQQYSNSAPLLGIYATFLWSVRKDYEGAQQYYQRALQADPTDANLLGSYALFLEDIRKDFEGAEQYYQRALQADPNHANNLGNYAGFLENIRKDYDGVEQYYQRALQADPEHANHLGNYANFLWKARKDYEGAEQYYQRALKADPKDATNLANYAGLLLAYGKHVDGSLQLQRAIEGLSAEQPAALGAEVWFYAYAHWPSDRRTEALHKLKEVLLKGIRSPNWDLSQNVERAREDGHPFPQWLQVLADVITKGEDIHKLDEWPEWTNA